MSSADADSKSRAGRHAGIGHLAAAEYSGFRYDRGRLGGGALEVAVDWRRSRLVVLLGVVALLMVATLSGLMSAQQPAGSAAPAPAARWFKGNTHTHTLNSDGDSTPDDVVRWYRERRYHFLVLSDHDFLTPVEGLNAALGAEGRFLLIPGEEVSDRFEKLPVHLNALNLRAVIPPQGGTSVADVVTRNVAAIRAAGALSQVNHPNFGWALTAADLLKVPGLQLMEIFNGHPTVNNVGGGGAPGVEQIWDMLLSAGVQVFGVASDDAHALQAPWNPSSARPGQGWVMVRADRLTPEAIVGALARGDFYASTGVELEDIEVTSATVTIRIKVTGTTRHRVQFIGKGGRVLAEEVKSPAVYSIRGDEGYVRAKVFDSNGKVAWTQPVRVQPR